MARVIATGAGQRRQNPFSQILGATGAVARGLKANDNRNAFEEATKQFTTDVEGGLSPQKALLRVAQTHPTAVGDLTKSGIVDAGQGARDEGQQEMVGSAFKNLITGVKSGVGENTAPIFDKNTGQVLPDTLARIPDFEKKFTDALDALSPDEQAALFNSEQGRKFIAGSLGDARAQLAQERAVARKAEFDAAAATRKSIADQENEKIKGAAGIEKERIKAGKPIKVGSGDKLVIPDGKGGVKTLFDAPENKEIVKLQIGDKLEGAFFFDKTTGDVTPVLDQNGRQVQGVKGSLTVNVGGEPAPSGERQKLTQVISLQKEIQEAESLLDPAFTGKLDSLLGLLKEKTGLGVDKRQVMFNRTVKNMQELLLRARSGAQINESEFQRMKSALPNVDEPDAVFLAKMQSFRREVDSIIEVKTGALEQSGFVAPKFPSSPDLSSMTDAQLEAIARGE